MTWLTCIGFNCCPEEIRRICEDIRRRDPTFKYAIYRPEKPPLSDSYSYVLIIESETREQAQRRGMWMVKKVKPLEGSLYWVKEKSEGGKEVY